MPLWFAWVLGCVGGLVVGFVLGHWSKSNDAEDVAVRALDGVRETLEAIPKGPCRHCGKMRGEPVEVG